MNETDLCYMPATELADAIRAKKLSAVEITSAVLESHQETGAEAQRLRLSGGRGSDGRGASGRSRAGQGRSDRAAARRAGDDQGPRGRAGHADRVWHLSAPRRGRGGGQRHGRPPARGGRGHPRQDDDARVRLDGRQQQPADRHHAQSLEARHERRRLVGRRRRRRGGGLRTAAPGQRRRGLDPHAGAFQRRVRAEADLWPRAAVAGGGERPHRRISARSRARSPMPR